MRESERERERERERETERERERQSNRILHHNAQNILREREIRVVDKTGNLTLCFSG